METFDFKNKTILITGGTGFLGTALIKALICTDCHSIRVFSRDEFKQAQLLEEINYNHKVRSLIGDVRDYARLEKATEGVDIVCHCAALKRIDMIEYNVEEAIQTNVIGTLNLVRACLKNNVEKAIFISSDKSCSPVNSYGATKFLGERIFTESNFNKGSHRTIFCCVRYGNVLCSTGSVVPFFINKFNDKNTTEIPITHREMTRFIITKEQAVLLVFNAIKYGIGGEIFVPRLPSFKVLDLYTVLCDSLNNHLPYKVTGVRPGEKIHELMICEQEFFRTYHFNGMFVITSQIGKFQSDKKYDYLKKEDKIDFKELSSKDFVIDQNTLRDILIKEGVLRKPKTEQKPKEDECDD